MRNRDYKNFAAGEIYHVYNRGVNKENIFLTKIDYEVFLYRLKENLFPDLIDKRKLSWLERRRKMLPANSFDLIAYCLMPNHFHMLIQQKTELPITKLISKICTSYSMYFNKSHGRVGTIFQDRFKSVLIESNEQLLWTSYYIHLNSTEAGITKSPDDYKWSSYLEYLNPDNKFSLCKKEVITKQFNSEKQYLRYFESSDTSISPKDLYFDFEQN